MRDYIEQLDQEHSEWVKVIGEFILACGDIEAYTFDLVHDLLIDEIPVYIKNLKFEQRIQLVQALLTTPKVEEAFDLVEPIKKLLSRAQGVMATRNVIAHNPLDLRIVAEPTTAGPEQVVRRYYPYNDIKDKEITLSVLTDSLTEAQLVASGLNQCAGALRHFLDVRA